MLVILTLIVRRKTDSGPGQKWWANALRVAVAALQGDAVHGRDDRNPAAITITA